MRYEVVAVHDRKARAYCAPFLCTLLAVGVRGFADATDDKTLTIGKNPEDFSLYHLGSWDDSLGKYELHSSPLLLCNGSDFHIEGKNNVQPEAV